MRPVLLMAMVVLAGCDRKPAGPPPPPAQAVAGEVTLNTLRSAVVPPAGSTVAACISGDTKGLSRIWSQTWAQIVEAPVGVMPVFASFDSKLGALSGLTKTRLATIDRMNEKAKAARC